MTFKVKYFIITGLFAVITFSGFAQRSLEMSVISVFGTNSESTSHNISQTVGELMTQTFEGQSGNYFLTQGFHQETDVVTSVNTVNKDLGLVYPNPTKDRVYIDINKTTEKIVKLDLYDITGKMLKTTITDLRFNEGISLSEYQEGIYLLRISNVAGKLLHTYKIEKTR